MSTVVVAREEVRRGLPAEITVDALLVDVELPCRVVVPLFSFVGHGLEK
jgi:hypothetical protein